MVWIGFGFLLGIILGSFAKALADRSLTNKSFWGRSYCPSCKKTLRWYDLFPIFSYLQLKGKCRYCHKEIPPSYLLIEVLMGLLISFLFYQASANFPGLSDPLRLAVFSLELLFQIFIIVVLVIVAITDFLETIIPDRITLPSVAIGLVLLISITATKIYLLYQSLISSVIGKYLVEQTDYFRRHALITAEPLISGVIMGVLIGLFFLVLILITKGRGMGGGDLKLGVFLGLVFGFPSSILVIMLAFLTGSVAAIALIILGKRQFGQTIPFGPFLSLGGILVIYWGDNLLKLLKWS